MKKAFPLFLILATLVLVAAACSAKPATQAPEPTAAPRVVEPTVAKAAQAPATEAPKPTAASKPAATQAAPAPTAIPTEDTLALTGLETGLDQLKSYRMTWQGEWNATEAGKAVTSTWNMQQEYTASSPSLHRFLQQIHLSKEAVGYLPSRRRSKRTICRLAFCK